MSFPPLLSAQIDEGFFGDRSDPGCIRDNGAFCVDWLLDNADRYVTPTQEHLMLVLVPVVLGFLIAFGMSLASHRRPWLMPPFLGVTGVLYTVPSLAFFFLLLPVTGRGTDTAIIALTAYTLQIIYRNIVAGLANVPAATKDAARGVGMTDRQLLWRVELPLAMPEIFAGVRIATVSTVAIASLAVFAGGGGLGTEILSDITFRTGVVAVGLILIAMAVAFDLLLVLLQRRLTRWSRSADAPRERRLGGWKPLRRPAWTGR